MVLKIYKFIILKLQFYILTVLNYLIPKSKNKIFIFDKRYRKDNVWAIAEYISNTEEYKKYEVYYYTKKELEDKNNVQYISSGFYALWNQLRANYIFYSYADIKRFKPVRDQKVIDTMHGSPLKNIGYLAGQSRFKKLWRFEDTFSHILCVSDFFKDVVKRSFGAKEEQCIVLGYPRNDMIFKKDDELSKLSIDRESLNNIIMWLPTWRGDSRVGTNKESDSDFPILNLNNIDYLNEFLLKSNTLLIIKPHPNQLKLNVLSQKHSNIKVFDNKDLEENNASLYKIFGEVDALLTDYSSVYFDFLLTMKPIGFTIDDFDSYGDKRGFVVEDPLKLMPGKKLTNMEELILFINDLKEGKDEFYDERKRVNDIANKYKDGNSTKRILEYLGM
ncbi:MAG: CDP-glycerol glycerophosphotransferase family protein [Tissierella sp.]|uniref:CDP-glycerol glycerophosphotransferase family protein n=1 Tax=Tissierella sp. TaxID=41274 RepID=UPI003F96DF47